MLHTFIIKDRVTLLANFDFWVPILVAGGAYWVPISQKVGSLLGPYFKACGSPLVFGTVG